MAHVILPASPITCFIGLRSPSQQHKHRCGNGAPGIGYFDFAPDQLVDPCAALTRIYVRG
jgi:hypothetical protein